MMADILSIEEIKQRFDSEWILVENPETNADLEIVRGKVVCHSKDRDEVYRKAVELRLPRFATLYTGDLPANTGAVLVAASC